MKRVLTVLLVISMIIPIMAACGSIDKETQNTEPSMEEGPEIIEGEAAEGTEPDGEEPDKAGEEPQEDEAVTEPEPIAALSQEDLSLMSQWRGFNLMEKFDASSTYHNAPFKEEDFKWISELGFNFVRLPMDYRIWIIDGDWNKFNEDELKEIDQAVEWGRKYGVHVQINFHRGPGYCVNPPAEPKSLWTDEEAQEAFVKHWAVFAERYKGISNKELSFNLLNEPSGVDDETYAQIVKKTVDAIRKADPKRLVVVDSNSHSKNPLSTAKDVGVGQSFHLYEPFGVTHYKASWIDGSDKWPEPQWPVPQIPDKLYASGKRDLNAPFIIEGDFKEESEISIRIQVVSSSVELMIRADGKDIFNQTIESGPGEGDWKKVVYAEKWDIYQNVFDRDYTAVIPAHTKKVEIRLGRGDWLSFSKVEIKPLSGSGKNTVITPTAMDWGIKPSKILIDENGDWKLESDDMYQNKAWMKRKIIAPWIELKNQGAGVMVGEFGVLENTPEDVALSWMKDALDLFKEAGFGWALWEFRGGFGIMDNNRPGAEYIDFHGHKLDKKMVELLQKY